MDKQNHALKRYLRKRKITYNAFGQLVGTTGQYIYHIASGKRKPGPELAKRIEDATGGQIGKEILRPDIWEAPASL